MIVAMHAIFIIRSSIEERSMELSINELNGVKIYKIKDDKGYVREVTPEFVKFALENGEIDNCYIDSKGNIFTDKNRLFSTSAATTYLLLGKLFDENKRHIGYLVQNKITKKVSKANEATFLSLVIKQDVEGAFLNENNDLCLNCGTDEYTLTNVNGKLVPRKTSNQLTTTPYTMTYSCDFSVVYDNLQTLESKFIRSTAAGATLGKGRKYPDIAEVLRDGITVQFDETKIVVKMLNAQDITDDIANNAELLFYLNNEAINVTILNIDYRLNALSLVVATWLAYKKLVNNFAKITEILISGKDNSYWAATLKTDDAPSTVSTVKVKTRTDINTLQEMYQIDKSKTSIDISDEVSNLFIQGLKLGTCSIIITCTDCSYTSVAFRLNMVEKQVYMKFQTLSNAESEEISYTGKSINALTPVMACIIAATAVAATHTITMVSIMNHRDGSSFELIFKSKSSREVQTNLIDMLNS